MWLADRRPPSALAQEGMNRLRTRIKKRSAKYTFYKPRSKRKDVGSERVDWVFVGFPKAPTEPGASNEMDNAPLTFEPLRPASRATSRPCPPASNQPLSSQLQEPLLDMRPSSSSHFVTPDPMQPEPIWAPLPLASSHDPPPLPPRGSKVGQRPPPPRPASLYASLSRVPSSVPNPADEYAQVIRSGRKRPKSSEMLPHPSHSPPVLPSNYPSFVPEPVPPVPRHMHGTGVPFPLPDSPPAPPLPPHASPIDPFPPKSPSPLPRFESLNRSIDSPFYQRPMSLASSSLARSMSSSRLVPTTNDRNVSLVSRTNDRASLVTRTNERVSLMSRGGSLRPPMGMERSYDSVHVATAASSFMDINFHGKHHPVTSILCLASSEA